MHPSVPGIWGLGLDVSLRCCCLRQRMPFESRSGVRALTSIDKASSIQMSPDLPISLAHSDRAHHVEYPHIRR